MKIKSKKELHLVSEMHSQGRNSHFPCELLENLTAVANNLKNWGILTPKVTNKNKAMGKLNFEKKSSIQ